MPGPLPVYGSNAARQRAYRQRQQAAAQEEVRLAEAVAVHAYDLQEAVQAASAVGDADRLAREVYRDEPIATLRALIDYFYDQAGTPAKDRPWFRAGETP